MAFMRAREKLHEHITVEHLLLTLLDNPSASKVLHTCSARIDELRKLLDDRINDHTPIVKGEEVDTQSTLGFQRVIQRSILQVQSSDGPRSPVSTFWWPSSERWTRTRCTFCARSA